MPELPEVETVARKLKDDVLGVVISSIEVLDSKLKNPKYKKTVGLKITDVFRSGKQVVLELSQGRSVKFYLCVHLRMTGRLLWQNSGREKHVRLRLVSSKGNLDFVDVRRFGTVVLCEREEEFKPNAVDPILDKFDAKKLRELIAGSRQEIKTWLLRQDRLIGIGNIYASEILFKSGIDPRREASSLDDSEISKVARYTKSILKKAIKNCGTTFSDFQDSNGEIGNYQNYLDVYQRAGEECRVCDGVVEKIVQGQRSTFYCEGCQG